MKKQLITTILLIASSLLSLQAQRIAGSETLLVLTNKIADVYEGTVEVSDGGSSTGIEALINKSVDIAMSSRKIKFEERMRLPSAGKGLKEEIVAYDGVAVIVNSTNKVLRLTREQLEGIFTGKITNWKELGGGDLKIVPYAYTPVSGTYEFFKERVLKNNDYKSGISSCASIKSMLQMVGQNRGAIGYAGFVHLTKGVKTLSISYDMGKSYALPTFQTVKDRTYPLVRPLYYYYLSTAPSTVQSFVDYVLSSVGQKIVSDLGYFPVSGK